MTKYFTVAIEIFSVNYGKVSSEEETFDEENSNRKNSYKKD